MTKRIQKSLLLCLALLFGVCLSICFGAFSAPQTAQAAGPYDVWTQNTLYNATTIYREKRIIANGTGGVDGNIIINLGGNTVERGIEQRDLSTYSANASEPFITVISGTVTIKNGAISANFTVTRDNQGNFYNNGNEMGFGFVYAPLIRVESGATLILDGVTVKNTVNGYNGTEIKQQGAAISNSGDVVIRNNSLITSCFSDTDGGAIYNAGSIEIDNSVVTTSVSTKSGGAIYNAADGLLRLKGNSAVTYSKAEGADGAGGGIYNKGTLQAMQGRVAYNEATKDGGGIYSNSNKVCSVGTETTAFTIEDNTATRGGGLEALGSFAIENASITGNSAFYGGGIWVGR